MLQNTSNTHLGMWERNISPTDNRNYAVRIQTKQMKKMLKFIIFENAQI